MVLFVQIIIEIHQLLDAVADVPVVRVVQVLTGAVVEETVELTCVEKFVEWGSTSSR